MIRWLKTTTQRRADLFRARMRMRQILDYELIGRYCGLLLFPFVLYVCVGQMQSYSDHRIRSAVIAQANSDFKSFK